MRNNAKQKRLNDKQRLIVERNHNLIYSFAYKNNLNIEDYYGTLAIGLCKAASIYDESKSAFSTLAFRCMENELYAYWKKQKKQSAIPNDAILSYDKEDSCNQKYFVDCHSYNTMMYDIMSSEFADKLNENEKVIFNCLINGETQAEIAGKLGCKRQNVGYYIRKIRKKLSDYLNNR